MYCRVSRASRSILSLDHPPSNPVFPPFNTVSLGTQNIKYHHGELSSLRALEPPAETDAERQGHPGHQLRSDRKQRFRVGGHAHDFRRLQILRWYVTGMFFLSFPFYPRRRGGGGVVGQRNEGKERKGRKEGRRKGKAWLMSRVKITGGFYRAHLIFPPEYPHLPPKMTFQTPIFHPNGTYLPPPTPTKKTTPSGPKTKQQNKQKPPYSLANQNLVRTNSLPHRRRLHLHPARARQRPLRLRIRQRALVPRPDARDDPAERHQHAEQSERREPGERGGGEAVEGGRQGVSEEV